MDVPYEDLITTLNNSLKQADRGEVKAFVNDSEGGSVLLRWRLMANLRKHPEKELRRSPALDWILTEPLVLELLLTSGYVQEHKWTETLNLLAEIVDRDPEAKCGYRLRLAIALALTFSSPVKSLASYQKDDIDPIHRYESFTAWAEAGKLFPSHLSLSPWHLRYVVASWAEDHELEWARNNVPDEFKTPEKIGEAVHKMVKYIDRNDSGVSIHEGEKFYNSEPLTMSRLYEAGAVCGGISKFGAAMAQAFGVPATPVAQPGHCAFLWWNQGEWRLSNDVEGLARSTAHDGIQWTWDKGGNYLYLMEEAQRDRERFVLSEKLRWASKFVASPGVKVLVLDDASSLCPSNFLVWRDLANVCGEVRSGCSDLDCWVQEEGQRLQEEGSVVLSTSASVTVSDCEERAHNLVDGTESEWWTEQESAWIQLDLCRDCVITELRIQWWGTSVSKDYIVMAAGEDGVFHPVTTVREEVESPQGFNSWSRLAGWDMETAKIKIELREGSLDPWGMNKWFGIRNVIVSGREVDNHKVDTVISILERKARRCLTGHQKVEADVCKLIKDSGATLVSGGCRVTVSDCEERAHNLLDGTESEWWTGQESAWIQLDLGRNCDITGLCIEWWGASVSKDYTVMAAGVDGVFHPVTTVREEVESPSGLNGWSKLGGWKLVTRQVRLELRDGCPDPWGMDKLFGIRNIEVRGREV